MFVIAILPRWIIKIANIKQIMCLLQYFKIKVLKYFIECNSEELPALLKIFLSGN